MRARLEAIAGQPTDRKTKARTARPRRKRTIRTDRLTLDGPPREETAIGSLAGGTSSCDPVATVRLKTRSEEIWPARLEQTLQLDGERKVHVLPDGFEFLDQPDPERLARVIHDLPHEDLRGGRARRQAED